MPNGVVKVCLSLDNDKLVDSPQLTIDLFSLYILFSQCRSCVVTLESCFFEISSYSRAYVRIIYEKTKGKSLWEHHMTYIGKT